MFEAWGRVLYARRRLVLVIAGIGVAIAAVWGTGVFGALQSGGGFSAPGSQSQQASDLAAAPSAGTPLTWWCCTGVPRSPCGTPRTATR
jgi:hypothetical protein